MNIVVEQDKDSLVCFVHREYVVQMDMYMYNVDLVKACLAFAKIFVVAVKVRQQILMVDVLYIDSTHKGDRN